MEIRRYRPEDQDKVMALIQGEGEEWTYWLPPYAESYRRLLGSSLTYVAVEGEVICGFSRSLVDGDFYVYVCDLLVGPAHRGQGLGRRLMECIYGDYPGHTAFVMSDVDPYYRKLGYPVEGTIFTVTPE